MNWSRCGSNLCALLLACGCLNFVAQAQARLDSQSPQIVILPKDADLQRLKEQRAVVEKYLAIEDARKKYQTPAGKLGLLRSILKADIFHANQTYELQCLGVVLGDVFVQDMKMEWVIVEEKGVRDPAVRLPGTTIILYLLTMISKRVERGDKVDVFDLYNDIAAKVEEMQKKGH